MSGSDDQVVVELVAQTSGFVSGMKGAASSTQEAARTINSGLNNVSESINDVVRDAAKLIGIGIGVEKIIELGKQSLETAERVDRMSQSLGVSTQTVQTMGYAAALVGSSLDSMGGALAKLERSGEQAAAGNKQAAEAFRAIGINGQEVAELLKNPDQMIKVITGHLASFADGSGKTAVTMQLLGRGAAENIPLINKLGNEYEQLEAKAKAMGIVLSHDQTQALADAEDRTNDLGQQVHGLANLIMIEMLPALDAATEAAGSFLSSPEIRDGIEFFGQGIRFTVEHLDDLKSTMTALTTAGTGTLFLDAAKQAGELSTQTSFVRDAFVTLRDMMPSVEAAFSWIKTVTTGVKDLGAQAAAAAAGLWNDLALGAKNAGELVKGAFSGMLGGANASADAIAKNTAAWDAQDKKIKGALEGVLNANHATKDLTLEQLQGAHASDALAKGTEAASKAQINYNAAVGIGASARKEIVKDIADLEETIARLAGQMGGPSLQIFQQFEALQIKVDAATAKLIEDGGNAAKAEALHAEATKNITAALQEKFDVLNKELAIGDKYLDGLRDQIKVLGLTENQTKAYVDTQKLANDAISKHVDLLGDDSGSLQEVTARVEAQKPAFQATTQALLDQADAIKHAIENQKEYVSAIEGGGMDALHQFTDALTGAGDGFDKFGKHLVDDAKQIVSQLLFTFLKLNVLGPFFANLFGSASGFAGMFGGASGGGGSIMSMIPAGIAMATGNDTTGGGSAGGAGGGGSGFGGNIGTAYQMYQNGWGGIKGMASSFWNGSGQTMPFANYLGSSVYGPGMETSFAPSALGWGASIAGGAYAGYSRYQNSGGGAAGVAGGLAYGVGTTAIGLGAAGVATGAGFAAGVGAMGALGPIGWAAIALMLVDMVSGGKLFGTKGKFNFGEQAMTVGATGATVTTGYDLKGQKAMFGGSTHKWVTTDTDPAAQAAADAFFDAITKQMVQVGKTFGIKAGDVIDATFVQTFDKHGNIKKSISTVMGETFNDTAEQFTERVGALSIAGTLDQLGIDVTGYIQTFKANADDMAAAIQDAQQFLKSAQTNIAAGTLLLTGQKTLKDTWDYVQSMQQVGETLSQTYQTLVQAAQTYNGIMKTVNQGIFGAEHGNDPGMVFAAAVVNIDENTQQMIAQLNAAAVAAGLQGASEADLAKVHKYAAIQIKQAIATLQSTGASLVDALYGTGTLSGINATISAIESQSDIGSTALGGFGRSITDVAQRATDAMNLVLGSLSPYNDEQKLQLALQGYQQGTVTKEQVLEIGRNLYATGQQYTDLFNMLQHMPSHGGVSGVHGGGGLGGTHNTGDTHGLNRGDLQSLYAQRDAIQKQQRAMQAQQLAQTVAQLSNAQGLSYEEVAKELNFNLKDLAKDLNVSLGDLPGFLDKLKTSENIIPDTLTAQTDRVVDILKRIFVAVGGDASDLPPDGADGGDAASGGNGHSGHARGGAGGAPVYRGGHGGTRGTDDAIDRNTAAIDNMTTEQRRTNDMLRQTAGSRDNVRGIRTPALR